MPRVTYRHYAEELTWWAVSGWALDIEEEPDGGLWLHTFKQERRGGTVLWGARATAADVATPRQVRRFLTEALYHHLHPRKAALALGAYGAVCTDKELAAFIRQLRRKVAKARRLGVE